jgi:hypothetical protein
VKGNILQLTVALKQHGMPACLHNTHGALGNSSSACCQSAGDAGPECQLQHMLACKNVIQQLPLLLQMLTLPLPSPSLLLLHFGATTRITDGS